MTPKSQLAAAAAIAALTVAIACSDIVSPDLKGQAYEWRLVIGTDTLNFHWPRNRLPVKIWVEDQYGMPGYIREGIREWRAAFLYGEWDGVLTGDSNTADVIVRTILPPPQSMPASAASCQGATDIDTVTTRFELRVPVRLYVYPSVPNAPDITRCLQTVATHELGHSLGIFRHSQDSTNIMFGVPVANAPSTSDIATAILAYHLTAQMVPVRP
jgi:predicted Zn-dependent protease